jgi:hypothetical protein
MGPHTQQNNMRTQLTDLELTQLATLQYPLQQSHTGRLIYKMTHIEIHNKTPLYNAN